MNMGDIIEAIKYLLEENMKERVLVPAKQFYEDTEIPSMIVTRLRRSGTITITKETGYKNGAPFKRTFLKLNEDRIPLLMKYLD